jgi:hypothetical protein
LALFCLTQTARGFSLIYYTHILPHKQAVSFDEKRTAKQMKNACPCSAQFMRQENYQASPNPEVSRGLRRPFSKAAENVTASPARRVIVGIIAEKAAQNLCPVLKRLWAVMFWATKFRRSAENF